MMRCIVSLIVELEWQLLLAQMIKVLNFGFIARKGTKCLGNRGNTREIRERPPNYCYLIFVTE
jgi:hypothetical protein